MMNADLNSPSLIIRDTILERIKVVPTFQSVKLFSTNPMKGPVQPENLPYLGCYLMEEQFTPIGDANHCDPRFTCNLRVGFSIQIRSNDNAIAEKNLDSAHWTIMRLLENQAWWNMGKTDGEFMTIKTMTGKTIKQDLKIEGIIRGNRRFNFGPLGQQQETSWGECFFDLTIVHKIDFQPYVPDFLDLIHVTVAYPWPYDPNRNESFTVVYDLTSDDGLPSGPVPPVIPPWGPQP